MKITIRHRVTNATLFETDINDAEPKPILAAITKARETGAYLNGADLYGANLYGANLYGANLSRANLYGANLYGANLYGANLYGADLTRANLYGANLYGANLYGADLTRANLTRADLTRADLTRADLYGANLYGANLSRANLYGANLSGANLKTIRDDVRAVLDLAPNEVAGLLAAVREGRINGSAYEGECACLVGTIANLRGCSYQDLGDLRPKESRAAERWFLALRQGHTPATHQPSAITEQWILEWQAERAAQVTPLAIAPQTEPSIT